MQAATLIRRSQLAEDRGEVPTVWAAGMVVPRPNMKQDLSLDVIRQSNVSKHYTIQSIL